MAETTMERRSQRLELKDVPRIRTDAVDAQPTFSAMNRRLRHGLRQARRPRPTIRLLSNRAFLVGGVAGAPLDLAQS